MRQRHALTVAFALSLLCSPLAVAQSGVGVPNPPGITLPSNWTAGWCPQLKPRTPGDWIGHPDALRAGFDWRLQCPENGWRGWFAEWFPCTEAAICLGWNADLWGTKATHNGNFRREDGGIKCNYSLRDFHIAEVYWDKGHPAYQLMYATGEYPCKQTTGVIEREPIAPGTRVQRLAGTQWVEDVVKAAGRQVVEFESGVRMTVGDEDRKWRRTTEDAPPIPPTVVTTPTPTDPVSVVCVAGQECHSPHPPCPSCPPAIVLPPECAPIAAVRESADVIARNTFTAQRRRQRVADCIKAIERMMP